MITRQQEPCFVASCDKCSQGDGYDEVDHYHWDTEREAVQHLDDLEWMVFRGDDGNVRAVICSGCWEEMTPEEREAVSVA